MCRKIINQWCFLGVFASLLFLTESSMAESKLGVNNNKLALCPETPNCVSSQTESKAHYIQPIEFMGTQEEAYNRITQIINKW